MTTRERTIHIATARARDLEARLRQEMRSARLDRGLGKVDVARAIGISPSQYGRIERGESGSASLARYAEIFGLLGCELSIRVYPGGQPIRDAGHRALLERFRARLHTSIVMATEVPFPDHGDRRAWDAVVSGIDWRFGVEAETRPRDLQALERRLAIKTRDGDVDGLILLLLDSRANRELLRAHGDALRVRFPIPGRRALELLRAGVSPGTSTIILL